MCSSESNLLGQSRRFNPVLRSSFPFPMSSVNIKAGGSMSLESLRAFADKIGNNDQVRGKVNDDKSVTLYKHGQFKLSLNKNPERTVQRQAMARDQLYSLMEKTLGTQAAEGLADIILGKAGPMTGKEFKAILSQAETIAEGRKTRDDTLGSVVTLLEKNNQHKLNLTLRTDAPRLLKQVIHDRVADGLAKPTEYFRTNTGTDAFLRKWLYTEGAEFTRDLMSDSLASIREKPNDVSLPRMTKLYNELMDKYAEAEALDTAPQELCDVIRLMHDTTKAEALREGATPEQAQALARKAVNNSLVLKMLCPSCLTPPELGLPKGECVDVRTKAPVALMNLIQAQNAGRTPDPYADLLNANAHKFNSFVEYVINKGTPPT